MIRHRPERVPGFPWIVRQKSGRFCNIDSPWVPHWRDVLRWKLASRPPSGEEEAAGAASFPEEVRVDWAALRKPPAARILATWLGHSTFLLQLDGLTILTDPLLGDYCAPWPVPGLRRRRPSPFRVEECPPPDLILLSHSHFDHCDRASFRQLPRTTLVCCPLGLGPLIEGWGFRQVAELGWGDFITGDSWRLLCLPAQHASARTPFDRDRSLWCSWLISAGNHRIFFAGDTGYARFHTDLGRRLGPVDLALLPIGAYRPSWLQQPLHLNPREAVQLHLDLGAAMSLAMHWGTFRLSDEPWNEPVRLLAEARKLLGVPEHSFRVLKLGETVAF
ncbi:MBL fold metallo-hydrolase [Methylacidimicrobium sp. B4]|uniref:MBL fold metallo-hydrolase n=1 Tax=Methylacidimicrobium sp. B4 TaxID=2796139 RepID=UPI001A8C1E36|nr:MBL fold metallo-hydrolase [Methylacidimicrobium sp. B4]QSR85578.1 MBL fold metallo-hydrolase [Methylacidimicrobium sp. B4]